jgi:WD40 repeat protein
MLKLVCVSPNGSMMVATSDSGEVVVYSISKSEGYKKIASLPTLGDAGFSCSWDPYNAKFAVAGQDGRVCVWDVRYLNDKQSECRVAKLGSIQKTPKGAARCVKFSQGMAMDLLAFTEHTSFVNIVDARNFEKRQTIRLSQNNSDLNVTGNLIPLNSPPFRFGL